MTGEPEATALGVLDADALDGRGLLFGLSACHGGIVSGVTLGRASAATATATGTGAHRAFRPPRLARVTTPGGNDAHSADGNDSSRGWDWDNPYAATPPPPPPPGAPHPYGATPSTPGSSTDAVSVAALVTAALCCTGPIAIVLGIIGIVRTQAGQRRGRWMAVVGLIGGILATLMLGGLAALGIWFGQQSVTIDNAETGQCVDIQDDGETVLMFKKDCTEAHDGEIVHVGEYDEATDAATGSALNAAVCLEYLSNDDVAALEQAGVQPGDLMVIAADPEDMSDGDPYTCYVDPGRKLTEPVLD